MTTTPAHPGPAGPRLGSMASAVGRGLVINFAFTVGIQTVILVQALIVPRLLGPANIGLFALAQAVLSAGVAFKELGVQQKLMQERDVPLPLAYSVAATLELGLSTGFLLVILAASPLVAAYFDRPELVPILAVLGVTLYTNAFLGLPGALHLRRLDYLRQNLISAIRPLVGFAVAVPLAFAGAGVWSLVAAAAAAFCASAAAMAWAAPLRPRLRTDRDLLRSYFQYGWPLLVTNLLGFSTTAAGTLVISGMLGLEALGFFSQAQAIATRAFRLDTVLAQTIFPALCRSTDDVAGQRRAFVATNRITVLWSGPIGFGLVLFAGDLVNLVLGAAWAPALFLFRMEGFAIVIGSIGYSWDVFFRARGNTRPTLALAVVQEGWVFVVLLPAVILWGIDGAAWAVATLGVLAVVVRQVPLRGLFPGINLVANAWRELVATGAAAVATAGVRGLTGPPRTLVAFAAQGVLFLALTAGFVLLVDRGFLADLLRRVRRPAGARLPGADALAPIPVPAPVDAAEALDLAPAGSIRVKSVAVPGGHPGTCAGHGRELWVTLPDRSALARLDGDGQWKQWRFPAYPDRLMIDDRGRAWVTLALAGSLAVVEPDGRRQRIRLGRTAALGGVGWDGARVAVVDAGRRLLWLVDDDARPVSQSLPPALGRPDQVVGVDGILWITDAAAPVVARLAPGAEPELLDLPAPAHAAVAEPRSGEVWLAHRGVPALTCLPAGFGTSATTDLPSAAGGLTVDDEGLPWVTLPAVDEVAAVTGGGEIETFPVPPGTAPAALAWAGDRLYVTAPGRGRLLVLG